MSAGGTGFQYGLLTLNRQSDAAGTTYYTRGNRGELLGQRAPGGCYYYLYDGLGSTAALTDSAGNVVNTYRYDPWGKELGSTGTVANPWRFGGGYGAYTDAATGLVKIGQRYYDPALGRWTQRDPLGAGNPYAYTNCNPVNSVDPSGLLTPSCGEFIADAVATVVSYFAGGLLGKEFGGLVTRLLSEFTAAGSLALDAPGATSDPIAVVLDALQLAFAPVAEIPGLGNNLYAALNAVATLYTGVQCVRSLQR